MKKDWDALLALFQARQRDGAVKEARLNLQQPDPSDWDWLADALVDDEQKWFVAAVFENHPVPKRLFSSFLAAAVNETYPSTNRQFVEPCIQSYGHRAVNEHLLAVVENGEAPEIAGAVAALYWANMSICYPANATKFTLDEATKESREAYLALLDIWTRKRATYLKVFVDNTDVAVRRQIIPSLKLDESLYPDDLKPLVKQAIEIARSHSDDYIRHRVEVQLGNETLLRPIPGRSHSNEQNT